jgi:putative IMPACT (imprinted ancient) family translation regulator
VKLGVGGLVRAYGEALQTALAGAATVEAEAGVRLEVVYDHAQTAAVMRAVAGAPARDVQHGLAGAEPTVALSVPVEREASFAAALRDATRGAVAPRRVGDVLLRRPART